MGLVPSKSTTSWLGLAVRVFGIAVVLGGLGWFVHEMKWGELWTAMKAARAWPLAVMAALSFVNLFCKAVSWRVMFGAEHPVPVLRLFRYTLVAFAVSAVAPARAGEALRVWLLKSRDQVPVARTLAVAGAEKVLDGVSLMMLVGPLPWLVPQLPAWVANSLAVVAAVSVACVVVLAVASGFVREPQSFLARFVAGFAMLRSARVSGLALLVLFASWIADLAQLWLVFWAVGVELPLAAGLLVLFTLNFAVMLPSTPGQVGALELGALAGLEVLGVPREQGLACALLYHAAQVLPLLAVGVLDLRLVLEARRSARETPAG